MTLRQVSLCHIFRKKNADIQRNIDHKRGVTDTSGHTTSSISVCLHN